MNKVKSKLITTILGLVIGVLVISIFFISSMITDDTENSPTTPKKTKAAAMTYSRNIALNKTPNNQNPTPNNEPTLTPTAKPTILLSPTGNTDNSSNILTPTPTEIILAYSNPSISPEQEGNNASGSSTISPTRATSLPETGYINNALIIFAVAGLLVFFSFLF